MNDMHRPVSAAPSPEADDNAAWHRFQFVLPLCTGRKVAFRTALPGDAHALLAACGASSVEARADIVLALDPVAAEAALADLPGLQQQLAPGGLLILATTDGADTALRAALARSFRHTACFRQRPIAGSLLTEERFAASRIVPLADAPATDCFASLHICSDTRLPDLGGRLFEATADGAAALPPAASAIASAGVSLADLPALGVVDAGARDLRNRAVSLVERLMAAGERTFTLEQQTRQLRAELKAIAESGGGRGGGGFDVPRTAHPWPLAENPGAAPERLDFYERRVDDAAVLTGREGAAFLAQFGLLDTAPDFVATIAALNAMTKTLRLVAPDDTAAPDVSIVIPVYGQLGYTLNCLDSLFRHVSVRSVEIIVIDDVSPDATGTLLPGVQGIRVHRQPVNGGFIRSCNTGAAMARGQHVVMLNNDTRVVNGWLDEMIDSFRLFPKAGMVGSKLLYPDGSLQEAGGIIWRDGSAWNYGRNDDPNRPQYCHARQADFISGAAICLPIDLWRTLGGFDEHYLPAYNEDTDLAFRVRAAGREVWFQPQSRIVHYEGKTSGTDTRTGVKAYQVINAKKFFLRWRDTLQTHRSNGEAPYAERERRVHRRALVIDATNPTPKQDAGSVTTTLNLQLLRELGYKVHFMPQDNFLFQPVYTTDLQRTGVDCAYLPYEGGTEAYLKRYGWMFDVVLVFRVMVLEKTLDLLRTHAPQAPVLFNNMDLHFLRMEREATLADDAQGLRAAATMRERELGLINRVDCTMTPSTFEKQVLDEVAPEAKTMVLPFMMEFFGTKATFQDRRDICFLGGYRHTPNVDAVRFFVTEVFPLIKAEEPDVRFIIAGASPTEEVLALARKDVIVTGLVDDLRDVFDTTRVFACSLRAGAGVKGKVAAAMAYGLPVVSTRVGAEGMDLMDGTNVLLADDPAAFAKACVRLYRDRRLWDQISTNSQRLVQEFYSLDAGRRVLREAIEIGLRQKLGIDA